MKRARALFSLLPLALVAALLSSCSSVDSGGGNGGAGADCLAEGEVSKSIEISGEFGDTPSLTSATPIEAGDVQRSVLIEGDGADINEGDTASVQLTFINGTSGEVLNSSPAELENTEDLLPPWTVQALNCASVGDRFVVTAPAAEIFGEGNAAGYGLEESDSLILVFDLYSVSQVCEELTPREEGVPEVELGDGTTAPEITIPSCMEAPSSLEVETLVEGDGAVVQDGDSVVVNYRGVIWRTGIEFDSSWSRGVPADFTTDGVIGGFEQALVGQKVGSTVLSIVPAEDGGYGADWLTQRGYKADDVMVFVLDILEAGSADEAAAAE